MSVWLFFSVHRPSRTMKTVHLFVKLVERPRRLEVDLSQSRDNILRVRGLETAPDTTKVHKTIIVILCCAGKSRQPNSTKPFCCVQTKLKSFSNWENHNRKLESVCPRYKRSENHNWYARLSQFFTKWPLEKPIQQLQSRLE